MRIIQTVNDTIRLLFNPKTEVFGLSDFLLVRDNSENFLAQVVEVYDDKFDQEANVAKIKLIYRIVNGNEIVPYDNYTPSRECEVAKIKQSEIEKCINLGKKTITMGISPKTGENLEINTNFLDNNCVIFADKFEQTNQIFENIAPRLASYKNVLILDFSGTCAPEGSTVFTAGENFKMPLSSNTIDYIQQKILMRAKLETQIVLGDVFEEVKNFLKETEDNYIPFQRFIKAVQTQCRQTPSVELLVLISWLKKYAGLGIFAKNKREFDCVTKSIEKNKITSIDFSSIKSEWQKEYVDYIINSINDDVFVMVRLNDNNINNDIINTIYLKKQNISFIPSFAYGYKKASYIMDFARNYILMPTLNPKRDFAHANFQIQSLNRESYMIFGEDTKDFIFILENKSPIKKRTIEEGAIQDKMFISLNLQLEDMTPLELRPDDFETRTVEPRRKRLHEEISLKDVLGTNEIEAEENASVEGETPVEDVEIQEEINEAVQIEENEEAVEIIEESEEIQEEEISAEEIIETEEVQEEIAPENLLGEDELDYFEQMDEPAEEITEENAEETAKEEIIEAEIVEEKVEEEPKEPIQEPVKEPVQEPVKAEISGEEIEKEINRAINKEKAAEMPKIKGDETVKPNVSEKEETDLKSFAEIQNSAYDNDEAEEEPEKPIKQAKKEIKNDITEDILDAIDEENGVTAPVEPLGHIKETKEDISTIIDEVVKEKVEEKTKEAPKAAKEAPKKETPAKEAPIKEAIAKEAPAKDVKEVKKAETEVKAEVKAETKKEVKAEAKAAPPKETQKEASKEVPTEEPKEEIKTPKEEAKEEAPKEEVKEEIKEEPETKPEKDEEADEIDKKFEEIMNEAQAKKADSSMLQVDQKAAIDLNKIKKEIKTKEKKLPVFNDDDEPDETPTQGFKEGDMVSHEKYGEGKIIKVITYGQRCLLQIEFPEIGKRLLDPKIAKLKAVEEV